MYTTNQTSQFVFIEINTNLFSIKLIKSDSKDCYNVTKHLDLK